MMKPTAPIGVFDSGIGGLSILKALRQAMPCERFVYFADTKHNPYGVKSEAFVQGRSLDIVQTLIAEYQIKALVVACNTATAAAIGLLRATFPDLPIVGVEPALKPAAVATRTGRVLVLATRGTLASEKFAQLRAKLEAEYAALAQANQRILHFTCVPCDGLADRIEQISTSDERWQYAPDLIAKCEGFMRANCHFDSNIKPSGDTIDTLVLGCTHYPLVRDLFVSIAGAGVMIVDNAQPVAQRTMQLIEGIQAPSSQPSSVTWLSSGNCAQLLHAARYWGVA